MNYNINGLQQTKDFINKTGKQYNDDFKKEMIKQTRAMSVEMQQELNLSADGGVVGFTKRAIKWRYDYRPTGITAYISVGEAQAKYLYDVIVDQSPINKFVPTSAVKLNRYGNIPGFNNNLKSGRYVVIEKGGVTRLVDTRQKDGDKRIIARREVKTRKIIWDFYRSGNTKAWKIVNNMRGHFTIRSSNT